MGSVRLLGREGPVKAVEMLEIARLRVRGYEMIQERLRLALSAGRGVYHGG